MGDAYLAANDLDKAQEAYLAAVEIDPNVAEVHSVLAYLYGKEGRIEEAISETLQVIELSRSQSLLYSSYKNLALFYQEQDRLEEAMRAAQEALARAPDAERAGIEGLIAQLGAGGAVPQTEALIQQSLAEGEAALNGQDWARADEAYERALALNPDLVIAHSALAYIYAQQGRLEEAEQENQLVLAGDAGRLCHAQEPGHHLPAVGPQCGVAPVRATGARIAAGTRGRSSAASRVYRRGGKAPVGP